MSSIVNLRTGLGPVLSLFGAKERWTSPLIKARTVPTLPGRMAGWRASKHTHIGLRLDLETVLYGTVVKWRLQPASL